MKRLLSLSLVMLMTLVALGQTQQGYVKTKGRLADDGSVIAGTRIPDATIKIKDRTPVISQANGAFSFPVPADKFYLLGVQKQGYALTDPEVLSKQYSYSANDLIIVMEDLAQQEADRRAIERKISGELYAKLLQRGEEIEALKKQNKITEEKYRELLQQLNQYQDDNEKIIKDMVEEYAKMDFDQIDEFNRKVSEYILNGELTKADSMLNSKGNFSTRAEQYRQHKAANAKEREELSQRLEQLEQSETYAQAELEELANGCYRKFEIFKMQHLNDSAAYYIELRASLDTNNVEWGIEAGLFIQDYLADFNKAQNNYQQLLNTSLNLYGETDDRTATLYDNIGLIYCYLNDFESAMSYHKKALAIREYVFDTIHPDVAASYCNIGSIHQQLGDYNTALDCFEKALKIQTTLTGLYSIASAIILNDLGVTYISIADFSKALEMLNLALEIKTALFPNNSSPEIAYTLNNIGFVYLYQGEFTTAMEYFKNALQIFSDFYGEEHPSTATLINNLGGIYYELDQFDDALLAFEKSLAINKAIYGEYHKSIAQCYGNIGGIYGMYGDYESAIKYTEKALEIDVLIFGENSIEVSTDYNNIGVDYRNQGKYTEALYYFNKALSISLSIEGEVSLSAADNYINIALVYNKTNDLENALSFFQKALSIKTIILGVDNDKTKSVQEAIQRIQSKLKEQENPSNE